MVVKRHLDIRSIAGLAIGYSMGLAVYPKLTGEFLDRAIVSRVMVAFGLPITATVIYVLFRSLWTHDRVRSQNGAFEATYFAIVFCAVMFVTTLQALVMAVLGGLTVDRGLVSRTVVVVFGLSFVAIGNLLPRTRPNVAVGLRTRLTLANSQLWARMHRVGGYVTVSWGLVVTAAGIVLSGELIGPVIGGTGLASIMIVVFSYRRYTRAALS